MRKKRRGYFPGLLAILLTAALLDLTGCEMYQAAAKKPPGSMEGAVHRLSFQVSAQLGENLLELTDDYADQVEKLSGGRLAVYVVTGEPDERTIMDRKCDMAYLRNLQLAQMEPAFSIFSLPFVYDNSTHMGVALNSEEMLQRLGDMLESKSILPLGAYYNGSSVLVSTKGELRMPGDFRDTVIALRTSSTDKIEVFERMGARVVPYQQSSLAELLGTQVELPPSEPNKKGERVTIDTIEVTLEQALEIPNDSTPLYAMQTLHNAAPLWLAINRRTWEELTEWERSVLQEAGASLCAGIETDQARREEALINRLQRRGVTLVLSEPRVIAATLYEQAGSEAELPAYFNEKLYTLIESFV